MKWISPMIMAGTQDDADALRFIFVEDPLIAAHHVESGTPVLVPSSEVAEELLRLLGAPDDWIRHHAPGTWALER